MKPGRHCDRLYRRAAIWTIAATLLHVPATGIAASSGPPAPSRTSPAVTLESVDGSPIRRVVLSAKAAERLDIQTGRVGEEAIVPRQMVSGLAVAPSDPAPDPRARGGPPGGFGKSTAGELWLRVTLSPAEAGRLAKDRPARVLPLATRENAGRVLAALPSGRPAVEDVRSSMLTLYYILQGRETGLAVGDRVRVELELAGSVATQKVVPYSAVYYDAKGVAWVYVNTRPLAFERQRIVVDRVAGDLAVLADGPAAGTPVVTVGAPLLYGAEIFGK